MEVCEAFSIVEFCRLHGFSRASYYNLPLNQRPREMKIGSRRLISKEAAAEWRAKMEGRHVDQVVKEAD